MKEQKRIDLGLTGLDELFMNDAGRAENRRPKTQEIDISLIDSFENHPFKVTLDHDMILLMDSIDERGLLTPIIVRPKENGRYELISGHRRKYACEKLGMTTIRAEIREMNRDEATILMVDSNLHRSELLPSEKAFSYKMMFEALKRQGARTDLTSSQFETKFRSSEEIAKKVGESRARVDRYIKITKLIPELLDLVDQKIIAMNTALKLANIEPIYQMYIYDIYLKEGKTPSYSQAVNLSDFSDKGTLSKQTIDMLMEQLKPNQKTKITISYENVQKYIPKSLTDAQKEKYVITALEFYSRYRNQNKDRDR